MHTFLWHDYETFGTQTRRDRPSQFAAIRTDSELNEIGSPIMHYCQPGNDYLPDPQSCLITGITPQICQERGIPEYRFAAEIEQILSEPGTIGVGYNTIRFDDEITRFLFWRNLINPYGREWQNNCGRWDILDMVRTTYALRQEGIVWPTNEEGIPSFRLEHLTAANGIGHDAAHDALSDVRATIGLARLIRQKQPKLFDFCFRLHKKERVAEEINLHLGLQSPRPFLHVSGMYPATQGCIAVVWPLALHPTNKNELIVWDLAHNPNELFSLSPETIRTRMFTKTEALPEGTTRLPIKTIHLNKSPIVISNLKTLSPQMAERWGISVENALRNAAMASQGPELTSIWRDIYERRIEPTPDVDEDLYGGFIGNHDRRQLTQLRSLPPNELAVASFQFEDQRLEELLFRYRARNFPESLTEEENQKWETHRAALLFDGIGGIRTVDKLFTEIDQLSETANEQGEEILSALYDYAESIAPVRSNQYQQNDQ